jgi:type IV pilus assembly protein PilA
MIVVAIVGILAALAVYGVSRYVKNAKTAEARNNLGRMGKDAVNAFQRETMAGTVLTLGGKADVIHSLCASAPPVPSASAPKAAKYQSKPSEWLGNQWACLRFSMNEPQYFQYEYQSVGGDANGTGFTCIAKGDLDGDGADFSTFTMGGKIQQDGNKKVASLAPSIEGEVNE